MKNFSAIRGTNWSLREKLTRFIIVVLIVNVVIVFFISRQCSNNDNTCIYSHDYKAVVTTTTSQQQQDAMMNQDKDEENLRFKQRLDFLEKLIRNSPLFKEAWDNSNNKNTNTSSSAEESFIEPSSTASTSNTTPSDHTSAIVGDSKMNAFWTVDEDYKENADKLNILFTANKTSGHKTRLLSTQRCTHHYATLILITTHATNFERREIIRKTWGSDPLKRNSRWKTMFLVGRPTQLEYSKGLIYEIEKYDDIILGDVTEDFYQLTHKILMGFEWALKYCSFDYMFKGDDDVFINLPRLFDFLNHENTPKKGLYAGSAQYQAHVKRTGRYAVSLAEFNKPYYPRYCSGGGFVLSKDVVQKFVSMFHEVPILRIDDAYVGILSLKSGVDVLDNKEFKMYEKEGACLYNEYSIAHHPVKTESCMKKLFHENLIVKRKAI